MLVLWQAHAVGTTDPTTRRVLRWCVARQRDRYGHLLTEGQQSQRIVSRNHGREAGGDRIEILDRFREESRPQRQRKAVPIADQETPAPIDATDLPLGLWDATATSEIVPLPVQSHADAWRPPEPTCGGHGHLPVKPSPFVQEKEKPCVCRSARMAGCSPHAHRQLSTMGKHWSVLVPAMDHTLQRPRATSNRDGLRHRSIDVVVPGIKARCQSFTHGNATPFCRCSLAPPSAITPLHRRRRSRLQ